MQVIAKNEAISRSQVKDCFVPRNDVLIQRVNKS